MSGRRNAALAAAAAALITVGAGWWALHRAQASPDEDSLRRDVPRLEGALIRFSTDFARRAGIRTAPAEATRISPVLSVTGTVAFDPERTAAVGSRIAGRARTIRRFEGDEVRPGDVLAEIESAELGQAQAALVSARAHAVAATANEAREQQLAEARVSAEREAEQARSTAASARADLFAAEQRVRALGGQPDGGELGVLVLRSPIAGTIVDAPLVRGQSVEPTFTAFRVADMSRLWVELAVFERDIGSVQLGNVVEVSPQTRSGVVIEGKVGHVGDVIDLGTRSAHVRVVVENPDGLLRPGQSVAARIHTAAPASDAVVVPRGAVVSVDGHPTVFVAHDETTVESRAVTLGAMDSSRVEVASGVRAGDAIVVEGVFSLKSELFR